MRGWNAAVIERRSWRLEKKRRAFLLRLTGRVRRVAARLPLGGFGGFLGQFFRQLGRVRVERQPGRMRPGVDFL